MNYLESMLKIIKEIVGLFGILGNVIGVSILIFYCFTIHFFPAGLSVGDLLLCLCIATIFGLLSIVFILVLSFANKIFLIWFEDKINKKIFIRNELKPVYLSKDKWFFIICSLLANILILLAVYFKGVNSGSVKQAVILLVTIYLSVGGMAYFEISILKWKELNLKNNDEFSEENEKRLYFTVGNIKIPSKLISITFIFLLPMITVSGSLTSLTEITLSLMGIRQSNVLIYIDKNYQKVFLDSENKITYDNNKCSSLCKLEHVNILMTNIGSNTKFEIPDKSTDTKIVFEMPTEAIKLKKLNL